MEVIGYMKDVITWNWLWPNSEKGATWEVVLSTDKSVKFRINRKTFSEKLKNHLTEAMKQHETPFKKDQLLKVVEGQLLELASVREWKEF